MKKFNDGTPHKLFKCEQPCKHQGSCNFCDGGLSLCTVCGGAESTLTTECCGYKFSQSQEKLILKGVDYYDGRWRSSRK